MATITRVYYDLVARDNASRAFRDMGDSATFAETRVGRLARGMAIAGTAVGVAAIAVGVESVRMATTFQAQMTRIQTQAGATSKSVKVLSNDVLNLASRRAQQGPQELAAALYHLKSVGMGNAEAMRALRTASDLAAVGGARLEDTTTALAGAWRSGIKGSRDFGKAAATVNAIIGAGNMRMEDFVQSLSSGILPAARTFHVSLTSIGSAMALMTDEGIPAEVAATRLRMTLSLLGAPSAHAITALNSIGLAAGDLARKMMQPGPNGGIVGAVALLKEHLDSSGLSAVKQAQVIAHAFGGGRSSSAIETLLNNLTVLQRKQEQITDTIGNYGADVAAQRKTAGAEFDRLKAIVESVGIRIGLALLPPVTRFVSFLVNTAAPDVARFYRGVVGAFTRIIPVATIKRDWHDVLMFLGLEKPPAVRMTTADLIHLPKPSPLYAGDLLHPMPGAAFRGIPDLLHPSAVRAAASGVVGSIAAALSGPNVGAAIGHALGTAMGWLTQHAATFTSGLVKALASLDWVNIGKAVGGNAAGFAIGFVSSLGSDLFSASFWEHHWWDLIIAAVSIFGVGKLGGAIARILEHVPILRSFAPLFRGLNKVADAVGKPVFAVVKAIWRGLTDGFTRVFPEVAGFLGKEFGLITDRIAGAAGVVLYDAKVLGKGILTGIEKGASGLTRLILNTIVMITKPFAKAGSWLIGSGIDVVKGLLSGIRRYMAGIANWVKGNIVNPIIHWVLHFFGISSPSRVMMGIGGNIMAGLFHGIMRGGRNLGGFVTRIFGSIPAALGHIVDKGIVSVASLPSRAINALSGLGSSVLSGIGGLLGKILGLGGGGSGGSPSGLQKAAQAMFGAFGWGSGQLAPLISLWNQESGWRWNALNPTSGAYGIPQSLPASKMASAGADWRTNPITQIRWGLAYIKSVYGSPAGAWLHERAFNWYGKGLRGGIFSQPTVIGVGERGRERVDVTPMGQNPPGSGPWAALHVDTLVVQSAADIDLLSQRLGFAIVSAGFGGG